MYMRSFKSNYIMGRSNHTRKSAPWHLSYGIEDFMRASRLVKSHAGRRRIPSHWSSTKDHDSDRVRLGILLFFAETASEMLDQSAT